MVLKKTLEQLPCEKPLLLDNVTCAYCGRDVSIKRTTEHVVGRRFVPRGMLDRQWNLIVWACKPCNGCKADLENDISAIAMQPDAFGRHAYGDPLLAAEGIRKGKNTFSRRTKKLVKDSAESVSIKTVLAPGVELKGEWTCAPQVDPAWLGELAQMQARAFFYFVTYEPDRRAGRFWRGPFMLVNATMRSDWGNVVMRGFIDAVVRWEPRVLGIGAGEFFKVAIRKHPEADCWSCAIEWNKNLRAVGFFGDEAAARAVGRDFPNFRAPDIGAKIHATPAGS